MGVDSRRPLLPAPTESAVDTRDAGTATELATDLSRRTDKTSYSIPDDGSPVTVPVRRKHREKGDRDESKLSRSSHHSQTSLLIEYFEGGKHSSSLGHRPSVRVRVSPSQAKRLKERRDHIQISESGSRKPSYSRRISVGSPGKQKQLTETGGDDQSQSTTSSMEDSRHPPVEIEFVNREQGSEVSGASREARYMQPTSDVSSMPPDSMVEAVSSGPRRKRSQSLERAEEIHGSNDKDLLKTPSRQRSRSLSTERIAHRVVEKLSHPPKEESGKHRRSEKSRRESVDGDSKSSKRRGHGHGHRDEELVSPESSMLSTSAVSRRSGDQQSIRSGTSSINNPRLLETVEDAIRRLILPELKELRKDKKIPSHATKFERDLNASSSRGSSASKDGLGRSLSKHASAPDVMKPKVVLNRDSNDDGITLAGGSTPRRGHRKGSGQSSQSSETSYALRHHNRDLSDSDKVRRQRSKGLRDAAAAGIVGTALTSAALKHHDSKSSLDRAEDGRQSQSRSRTGSVNETELVFQKHNVPAMPFRSELESDMTRTSLVSDQTDATSTPRASKTQEVSRGSPRERVFPTSRTPTTTPLHARHELDIHHSNLSSHDLGHCDVSDENWREGTRSPLEEVAGGAIAAAAAANLLEDHPERQQAGYALHGRALSPIQSVASDQSDAHIKTHSPQFDEHGYSEDERELYHDDGPRKFSYELSPRESQGENWEQESEMGYGRPIGEGSESKRFTGSTGDSEVHYMEKVQQGQHVTDGVGINPEFVQPFAVESAVASLLEPSVVDSSTLSGNRSAPHLPDQSGESTPQRGIRQENIDSPRGSPLKQRQDAADFDATSFPRRMGATSPPQSVTQSIEDQDMLEHTISANTRDIQSPLPEDHDHSPESESEINTNPSIIQGPIGVSDESRDNWVYSGASPKGKHSPYMDNVAMAASAGLAAGYYAAEPEADYATRDLHEPETYNGDRMLNPPGGKDEGYISGPNALSPRDSPQPGAKELDGLDAAGLGIFDSPTGAEDPLTAHRRTLSGYSHGIGSPLYDGATGKGIERIKSQDIVALMDHVSALPCLTIWTTNSSAHCS